MTTAIIIEDQASAERELRSQLGTRCPDVTILASSDRVVQGAKLVQQLQPDILFLDIELPDGTGFDLLDLVGDWSGAIIFITGLNDQALKAFRYAAVDYLVKPVDPDLLEAAVTRASARIGNRKQQHDLLRDFNRNSIRRPNRLALHGQDRIQLVNISDIIRLEAESNYTTFVIREQKAVVVGKTLKTFASLLEEHGFLRVHQSHLVNPSYITNLMKNDGGYLLLSNQEKIPVSVRRKSLVMDYINALN